MGASGIKAGDTLYNQPATYTELWTIGESGTAVAPIVIRVNPAFSGNVIFDWQNYVTPGAGGAETTSIVQAIDAIPEFIRQIQSVVMNLSNVNIVGNTFVDNGCTTPAPRRSG